VKGVTKTILNDLPELEAETFYRPNAKKTKWFLSPGLMLQKCLRGTGGRACVWYQNVSTQQVRPDWKDTWEVKQNRV
jgi:hypothetical protein